MAIADGSNLGKKTEYQLEYNPSLLFPMPRLTKREENGIPNPLPFQGYDRWNAFEISWLDPNGKPLVATAQIDIPCTSTFILESKSFKLYCNSFNQTSFENLQAVQATMEKDLSAAAGAPVSVPLKLLTHAERVTLDTLPGICIDDLPIKTDVYRYHPEFLTASGPVVTETLHSHLLKSNCLVTNQPDWGSVVIAYTGPKIDRENLLKYIISFRMQNDFAEPCIETIFMDLSRRCHTTQLTVYGCFTRRGGIDINPFRSNDPRSTHYPLRIVRQ